MKQTLIETEKDANFFIKTYRENPSFLVFDTETTGLSAYHGHVPFSVQFLIPIGNNKDNYELFYFQLHPYRQEEKEVPRTPPYLFKKCMNVLVKEGKKTTLIAHNIKFDLHMMLGLGVDFSSMMLYDTMIMARLLKNNLTSYSLKSLSKKYLPAEHNKDDEVKNWLSKASNKKISHLCKLSKNKKKMDYSPLYGRVPFDIMHNYAIQDVVTTWYLFLEQRKEVFSYKHAEPQYFSALKDNEEVEKRYTKVLFDMEKRGILVDSEYLSKAIKHEEALIKQYKDEYESLTGEEYFDSDKTLQRLFEEQYNIALPLGEPSEKLGIQRPKTDADTLESLDCPLADLILKIRKREKRLTTYFLNIRENTSPRDNCLHPTFNQTGAASLRMSSSGGLNVQNLPSRELEDEKFPIRGCFIPRKGYKLCFIDYSAQEVRLILDLAGETQAVEEIKNGKDPHQANADIAGCSRTQAKTVIFSILYGSGTATLAAQLGVSEKEAQAVKDKILEGLPNLKKWSRKKIAFAEEHGLTHNCFGVRYHWDSFGEKFYKAVNYDVQGGSAGITKRGGLAIHELLKSDPKYKDCYILIQVHDEYGLEVPEHFTIYDCTKIAEAMCQGYKPQSGLAMEAEPEIMKYRWQKLS